MKLILSTPELLKAPDYRGFLLVLYATNKKHSREFSFAYLAKRCRFSSKSFLKDVIDGKKRLSLESTNKVIEGLALPSLWGKYFLLMVADQERFSLTGKINIPKDLTRIKEKLEKRKTDEIDDSGSKLFQHLQSWPYVYAALGSQKAGSSLAEIKERTRLNTIEIEETLRHLINEKMVVQDHRRFYAKSHTAFFENLGKSEFFKKFYQKTLERLHQQAQRNFQSEKSLFYNMCLSVDPEKMAAFRMELADLLDKYTSDVEDPQGARIASLVCGLYLI
jgi:uncharacterized protein (TIGR02147 family)